MANVLCVVAHPDDEVLGAGGTLAKHSEAGDEVGIVYGTFDRQVERGAAATILGLSTTYVSCMALPDQQFDTEPILELSRSLEWMREHQRPDFDPDIIYTHHPQDLNLDHALTARAVLTAFRPKPGEKPRAILACEVLSSTEYTYPPAFQPNWYETLSGEQLQKKVDALACYASEVQPWPHPRSALGVRNLAAYRGQSVGVEAAEAFQLLRRT